MWSRFAVLGVCFSGLLAGQSTDLVKARELYVRTQYDQVLQVLKDQQDPVSLQLIGQSWFMKGDFKRATDIFEKAIAVDPQNSDLYLWVGRTYGRRAEISNPLMAPRYASKARQYFEKAIALDPKNTLAYNDLFEYYLQAPGFLGGGKDKAARTADRISELDQAEGFYARARIAEDRKEYSAAETQLRRAVEAAPGQVGRVIDLAKFLARQGRHNESEAEFQRAEKIAPNNPKLLFEKAATYIQTKRNIEQARSLLQQYLKADLTPDDPPRQDAEKLLKSAGS